MRTVKARLAKRIKIDGVSQLFPAVISANGRVKPHWVWVKGKEEHHPSSGAYYLEWWQDGKRRRKSVGTDHQQAHTRLLRKESELQAIAQGVDVLPDPSDSARGKRRPLALAVTDYLEETKLTKKPKTLRAYTVSLGYFQESCKRQYVEQIERADLLRFHAFLRDEKEQAPRSCWNKFANVMSFLKAQGIRGLVKKGDWPRFVETEVETYEREELEKLFAVCDPSEKLMFRFYLMTGLRDQEVMYCTWKDVNLHASTVHVRWKPEYNWTPKAYKEREVPIPDTLLAELKEAKRKATTPLLFPAPNGQPDAHMLRMLKTVATRGKMDPDQFYLHKFRATFATTALQAGFDLRTVQQWLGHSDMDSTLRYLRPARGTGVRARVNEIWA